MGKLTRNVIIDDIVISTGLSRKEVSEAIETLLDIIKLQLVKGETVCISGFGKWNVRKKNPRRGRNPQTGGQITIAPRRVVTFYLSKVLRSKLLEPKE
jgi:integration host factor subunit alpha